MVVLALNVLFFLEF